MIVIYCLFTIGIAFVLIMMKQANENHIHHHQLNIQGEEETIRLFFISDTHVRAINEAMIQSVKGTVQAVIIGGDFADKRTPRPRIEQNIKRLKQLGPVYFVWGNNDREVGEDWLCDLFLQYNVTVVENDALLLPNVRNPIWLSAIDDTSANYDIEKAIEQCKDGKTIFISHNPQIFYKVVEQFKPILMMGGHLHGGQIRFGKFALHPQGSFTVRQGVHTLISNGYGTTLVPFRLGAKPECHVIDIVVSMNKRTN
ncbi:metallophosphoesterase [Solibacillus sp. FSL H8-0538]|uniref:metallophosphoesterase n=1 Tax=Solibacillus sp. FSL H8-0538 TaxID=2921400 RepID=UPI0030F58180